MKLTRKEAKNLLLSLWDIQDAREMCTPDIRKFIKKLEKALPEVDYGVEIEKMNLAVFGLD